MHWTPYCCLPVPPTPITVERPQGASFLMSPGPTAATFAAAFADFRNCNSMLLYGEGKMGCHCHSAWSCRRFDCCRCCHCRCCPAPIAVVEPPPGDVESLGDGRLADVHPETLLPQDWSNSKCLFAPCPVVPGVQSGCTGLWQP